LLSLGLGLTAANLADYAATDQERDTDDARQHLVLRLFDEINDLSNQFSDYFVRRRVLQLVSDVSRLKSNF